MCQLLLNFAVLLGDATRCTDVTGIWLTQRCLQVFCELSLEDSSICPDVDQPVHGLFDLLICLTAAKDSNFDESVRKRTTQGAHTFSGLLDLTTQKWRQLGSSQTRRALINVRGRVVGRGRAAAELPQAALQTQRSAWNQERFDWTPREWNRTLLHQASNVCFDRWTLRGTEHREILCCETDQMHNAAL